ncbi:putative reductase [Anaeramoeba ignava]|uniref:Reductase n=1 Tax=Anaeramoeba ignava TaxID=1746090 RepID=A0A9Q0R794_ANAIG|nr:putative reductase [Anaeramoeba ignava]
MNLKINFGKKKKIPKLMTLAAEAVGKVLNSQEKEELEKYIEMLKSFPTIYMKKIIKFLHWTKYQKFIEKPDFYEFNKSKYWNQTLINEELFFRLKFANDRNNEILTDPEILLVNVFENIEMFKSSNWDKNEQRIPKVMDFALEYSLPTNILEVLCLRVLGSIPKKYSKSRNQIRNYFSQIAYQNSDIDIFIYGLDQEKATQKINNLINQILGNSLYSGTYQVFRSDHTISLVSTLPLRHIQFILRLYKSPAEILLGFDIDACSIGFDGKQVFANPRCIRAITKRYNLVDLTRRSPSYESRLLKYAHRGFCVAVNNLDRSKINMDIYLKGFHKVYGLAKLLILEKFPTSDQRKQHLKMLNENYWTNYRKKRMELGRKFDPVAFNLTQIYVPKYKRKSNSVSDYDSVYIPFSEGTTAKIQQIWWDYLYRSKRETKSIFRYNEPIPKFCYFDKSQVQYFYQIFNSSEAPQFNFNSHSLIQNENENENENENDNDNNLISLSDIDWVVDNPGKQNLLTGSFNRPEIDEIEWLVSAYNLL